MKRFFLVNCYLLISFIGFGQNFSGGFTFRLPSLDTTKQYFLPVFENEIIDDTSFVKTDQKGNFLLHGKPIKFWGVVMGGRGFAMDKKDAPLIAGRMRKMGINFIRLMMIDNAGTEGLFFQTPDTRHFNTTNLDKMEYFISHLKKNGIHILFTLLDLRPFGPRDGVLAQDSGQWNTIINKAFPLFNPKHIALQKEYASQILTHVNPYTGLSLANDPVMATVEIVNENSLFNWWRQEFLKPMKSGGRLIQSNANLLDTLWNRFLKNKYQTMSALTPKWAEGSNTNNPEILLNPGFEADQITNDWDIYLIDNAKSTLTKDNTTFHSGNASAKIVTTGYDGTDWHIMFIQNDFSLQKDTNYTVELWAKASNNTSFFANVSRQNEPYTYYGGQTYTVGTDWQKYRFSITPSENNDKQACLIINPKSNGTIWIDDISLKKTARTGVEPLEDFNNFSLKRIEYKDRKIYNNNRVSDLMEFYTKIQTDYFNGMKDYLKKNLGVKVPVEGTNFLIGPEDLLALNDMDYISNHSYWDHPTFTSYAWSPSDWKIHNTSMLKNDSSNTITYLFSGFQKKGFPFVVGEYNHAFSNRYQVEMYPLITAYSSFQGADVVSVHFYNQEYDWRLNKMSDWFTLHNNNAQMVNSPAFAYAFRNNLIKEASSEIELNYSVKDIYTTLKPAYYYTTSSFYSPKYALTNKVVTGSVNSSQSTPPSSLPPIPKNPYITSTGEVKWDTAGVLTIDTEKIINFTGFLMQFPNKALKFATLVNADNFGTVTWLSLDNTALNKSRKSMIALSTRQQNTGMIWDGNQTFHNNWGTAPTTIEPMKVILELSIEADSVRIFPMDTLGAYKPALFNVYKAVSPGKFRITLDTGKDKTCWYGIKTSFKVLSSTENKTICAGENYRGWTTTGIYKRTLQSKLDGDSIITTSLTVLPVYNLLENKSICNGQNYNGQTTTGIHKRILKSKSGCDSIITTNLTVISNYLPAVQIAGDTLISVDSYPNYQWYDENGKIGNAFTKKFIISKSGKYQLVITDKNGCTNSSSIFNLIYSNNRGFESTDFKYSIIPNPNSGQFIIRIESAPKDDLTLKLISSGGQIIETRNLTSPKKNQIEQFNTAKLSKGVYFLVLSSGWINRTEKIIIE